MFKYDILLYRYILYSHRSVIADWRVIATFSMFSYFHRRDRYDRATYATFSLLAFHHDRPPFPPTIQYTTEWDVYFYFLCTIIISIRVFPIFYDLITAAVNIICLVYVYNYLTFSLSHSHPWLNLFVPS